MNVKLNVFERGIENTKTNYEDTNHTKLFSAITDLIWLILYVVFLIKNIFTTRKVYGENRE